MNPHSVDTSTPDSDRIIPREGWHVLHLFYHIEQTQWSLYAEDEKLEAKTHLAELVQEIRSTDSTQLLTFSMVSTKADMGFMLLTDDLHKANDFEKRLGRALGPDVLTPVYSYFSMTELSEYTTTEEHYAATLTEEDGIAAGTPEMEEKLEDFRKRRKKYNQDRLYQMLATKASPEQMKQICGHLAKAFAALSDLTVSNERTVREASTAISMIYGVIVELVMLPPAEQIIFNEKNMVLSNWPGRIPA